MNRAYLTKQQAKAGRAFPSYTTKELKSHLRNELPEEMKARMRAEIEAREAGTSIPRVTPQVGWA